VPAAMSSHGKVDYLIDVGSEQQQQIGNMLLRRQAAALA
jgi:hypothetical protein